MEMMKAVRIHTFGESKVLTLEEVPRPVPGDAEVLVQIHAAGVIATDWQFRAGLMPSGFMGLQLPVILGWDIAGVVATVGANVTEFQVGDAVYAMLPGHGGYAEYVTVPAALLAMKPQSLDYVRAAAVPLAAMTAYKSLYDTADICAGQTVLIHGASGGVGSFGVQYQIPMKMH
jgi:NADPH:quinone reductase-like Zn-dependent oxidoreductase